MTNSPVNFPVAVLFALCLSFISAFSIAQSTVPTLGKIIYLEGKVEVSVDEAWVPAKMNHTLQASQSIRTRGTGMA